MPRQDTVWLRRSTLQEVLPKDLNILTDESLQRVRLRWARRAGMMIVPLSSCHGSSVSSNVPPFTSTFGSISYTRFSIRLHTLITAVGPSARLNTGCGDTSATSGHTPPNQRRWFSLHIDTMHALRILETDSPCFQWDMHNYAKPLLCSGGPDGTANPGPEVMLTTSGPSSDGLLFPPHAGSPCLILQFLFPATTPHQPKEGSLANCAPKAGHPRSSSQWEVKRNRESASDAVYYEYPCRSRHLQALAASCRPPYKAEAPPGVLGTRLSLTIRSDSAPSRRSKPLIPKRQHQMTGRRPKDVFARWQRDVAARWGKRGSRRRPAPKPPVAAVPPGRRLHGAPKWPAAPGLDSTMPRRDASAESAPGERAMPPPSAQQGSWFRLSSKSCCRTSAPSHASAHRRPPSASVSRCFFPAPLRRGTV